LREGISLKIVIFGAFVFLAIQVAFRVTLLNYVIYQSWFSSINNNIVYTGLVLGVVNSFFDELSRFFSFKFVLNDALEWKNGIAYGIGYGGFEMMVLAGLSYTGNLILSLMIHARVFDSAAASMLSTENLQQVKMSLIHTMPAAFLLGGIDRIFIIFIQMALTLVVLYGVMNNKYCYLLIAFLSHFCIDASIQITSAINPWFGALNAFVYGMISLIVIRKSRYFFSCSHHLLSRVNAKSSDLSRSSYDIS